MTLLDIVTPPDPVLRQMAQPVRKFDADFQTLVDDMIETMRAANGVGLAAPQVGRSLRLAVIETLPELDEAGEEIPGTRELYVIANPEISWHADTTVDGIEGCLSIPGFVGEVARPTAVRRRAQDRRGKWFKLRPKGWTARIIQHEIDHLDGVLYIDRLTSPDHFWREEEYYGKDDAAPDAQPLTHPV